MANRGFQPNVILIITLREDVWNNHNLKTSTGERGEGELLNASVRLFYRALIARLHELTSKFDTTTFFSKSAFHLASDVGRGKGQFHHDHKIAHSPDTLANILSGFAGGL